MTGRSRRPPEEGRLLQSAYHAYVALSRLALALPESWAYGLARIAGSVARRVSKKRSVVERNLMRVTGLAPGSPELEHVVRESFRSYARYWLETFRLVREDKAFFLERFLLVNVDRLDDAIARTGKGVVVVVGHLGNYDAAGAYIAARGQRLVTVAEVLRPRRVFDFFVEHRERLGMTIHPAERGVSSRLVEAVEQGAVVAILGDRDLKGTGPEVTFCGARTTMPGGAASIALRTRSVLMVAGVYGHVFDDGRRGWVAELSDEIPLPEDGGPEAVTAVTQAIADELEVFVKRRPEEWHVFNPFWIEDRAS